MNDNSEFYLEASVRKGGCKHDEAGNCLFEVEASNENLDFQNQKVLQRALMDSRDNFLKYGVISNDHLHHAQGANGEKVTCPEQIIGEPVDVRTEGGKTIVTAKLYRSNPVARAFIRLLKDGSTRVRASIGGIFPKVKRLIDGTEAVTGLLWNDLALTATPVNNTVGYARLVKSYKPDEFVKALTAGYQTDSAETEGGGALVEEDVRKCGTVDTMNETTKCVPPAGASCYDAGKPFSVKLVLLGDVDTDELRGFAKQNEAAGVADALLSERLAVAELIEQLGIGAIQNSEEALAFLVAGGIADDKAREYLRDIETQGGYLMKKSLGTQLSNIVKSIRKSKTDTVEDEELTPEEEGLFDKSEGAGVDSEEDAGDLSDEDIDLDDGDEDVDLEEDDEDDLDLDDEDFAEDEDEDDLVDATDTMKSMTWRLKQLEKSEARRDARVEKSINQIAKSVVEIGEAVASLCSARNPRIAKSYAGGAGGAKVPRGTPTMQDYERVQDVLQKSVTAGEITLVESSKMNREFQCAMHGQPLSSKTYAFLNARING